jgi:hypothetical protein
MGWHDIQQAGHLFAMNALGAWELLDNARLNFLRRFTERVENNQHRKALNGKVITTATISNLSLPQG